MEHQPALILVDLQNEFLSPKGNFPVQFPQELLTNIQHLTTHFRNLGAPIVWVRAEYPPPGPPNNPAFAKRDTKPQSPFNVLTGRHAGHKPCCNPGTSGAKFPEDVQNMIMTDTDEMVTKTWYSSFKETHLNDFLHERDVKELYIAGLLSNVCVLSTVTEAIQLGYKVRVVETCLGWKRKASHERALQTMRDLGVGLISTTDELTISGNNEQPAGESTPAIPSLYCVNGSIPSWRVLMALYEKVRCSIDEGTKKLTPEGWRRCLQNIPFTMHLRRVMSKPKETREPEFLALNHRGKTPVFVDPSLGVEASGGIKLSQPVVVNESLAILQYIETYHGLDVPLLPPMEDRTARGRVLARIQESENLHSTYDALEDAHYGKNSDGQKGELSGEERASLVSAVHAELDYWEVYAEKTTFIAGESFTLADCAFFPLLGYMVHRGFDWTRLVKSGTTPGVENWENGWPKLRAYFDRVWSRGGEEGCAQRAQPKGWDAPGRENVFRGN